MSRPNVFHPEWDGERDDPPYRWSRSQVGRQAGARRLGASVFELPPGAATFPLHVHHHNEEMLVVLSGRPTLRTLEEERELAPGEVVAHPAGREGAHRLDNATDEPVRLLIVSTMLAPEINEYPETGGFRLRDHAPGTTAGPGGLDVEVAPEG
jgi:uncharacterized cupin superfamily protein